MARILIVDDHPMMVKTLSAVVGCHGHETLGAYGGQEALDIIKADRPDIVLLDLMMPDMDGFETLRRLRAMPQGKELPVIVITAREENGLEERVISAGGNGFLQKPVEGKTLADIIDAHTSGIRRKGSSVRYIRKPEKCSCGCMERSGARLPPVSDENSTFN